MGETCYLVMADLFGQWHFCALFSTEEKANKFMKTLPPDKVDGAYPLVLDEACEGLEDGLWLYHIDMGGNGKVVFGYKTTSFAKLRVFPRDDFWRSGHLCGTVYAKNKQRAIKAMNERRAVVIANNGFDTEESKDE